MPALGRLQGLGGSARGFPFVANGHGLGVEHKRMRAQGSRGAPTATGVGAGRCLLGGGGGVET
jgi:hypothetical protein